MFTEYIFWFAQPSSLLNSYDWASAWLFAGMTLLGLILFGVQKMFVKHPVIAKLVNRYSAWLFWIGLIGLLWFGFRYESVPIFSKRFWAGIILVIGIIWGGFIKWYLLLNFMKEKREYDYIQLKNKYIK